MIDNVRALFNLRKHKSELEKEINEIKDSIKRVEAELFEIYIEKGVSSITVDGKNVILVEKKSFTCDQSPELVMFLEEHGFDDVFSKPINNQALGRMLRENPEFEYELSEHIKVNEYYQFSVRKK